MKRISKVNIYEDNWFSRLLYEMNIENFYCKARRNISEDKRRNLKRKFRVERNQYPYHHTELDKDLLKERQIDVECEDPIYVCVKFPYEDNVHKFANIPVTFTPKPLPG